MHNEYMNKKLMVQPLTGGTPMHMRQLVLLFGSLALLVAGSAAVAAQTPGPAAAPVASAPSTTAPFLVQADAACPSQALTAPGTATPGTPILHSPAGTPKPFWTVGGNCWNQFSACRIDCGGDSLCEQGCECTYCVCARLLCPNYCGGVGQN
jgi:hypothetical protein